MDFDRKVDLIGVGLVAFALVSFFAVIPSMVFGLLPPADGGLTGTINDVLSQLFGWGKIVWPVATFGVGVWLMAQSFEGTGIQLDYARVVGMISLYACVLTWAQMIELVDNTQPSVDAFEPISRALAVDDGGGGGWFGHQIYLFLLRQLLDFGTVSVLIAWLIMSLMLTFDLSVVELWGYLAGVFGFLRIDTDARARKRAAKEALAADVMQAMRPGEETRQLPLEAAAAAAAAGTVVGAKTADPNAPPTPPPGRRGAAVQAASPAGEAETAAAEPKPATADKGAELARSAPVINRRPVQTGSAMDATTAAQPSRAKADTDDQKTDDAEGPARRRMPRLRRATDSMEAVKAGMGAEAAGNQTEPKESAEDGKEKKSSRGRFGFLRRGRGKDEAEAGEGADTAARTDDTAKTGADRDAAQRDALPAIPVPPRRAASDLVDGTGTGETRGSRSAGEPAPGASSEAAHEDSDSEDESTGIFGRLFRRSAPKQDEESSHVDDAGKRAADAGGQTLLIQSPRPASSERPERSRVAAPDRSTREEGGRRFERPRPARETSETDAASASAAPDNERPRRRMPALRSPFADLDDEDAETADRSADFKPERRRDRDAGDDVADGHRERREPGPGAVAAGAIGAAAALDGLNRRRERTGESGDSSDPATAQPAPSDRLGMDRRQLSEHGDREERRTASDPIQVRNPASQQRDMDRFARPAAEQDRQRQPDENSKPQSWRGTAAGATTARTTAEGPAATERSDPENALPAEVEPLAKPRGIVPGRDLPARELPDRDRAEGMPLHMPDTARRDPDSAQSRVDEPAAGRPPQQASQVPEAGTEEPARPARPDLQRHRQELSDRPRPARSVPVPGGQGEGQTEESPQATAHTSAPQAEAEQTEAKQTEVKDAPAKSEATPARPARTLPQPAGTDRQMRPTPTESRAEPPPTPQPAPRPIPAIRPPRHPAEPAVASGGGANEPEKRAPRTALKAGSQQYDLPDRRKLLRAGDEQRIDDNILLDKARVIEDTLTSFGAPGKVVEVNPGPVITQFGVEPSYLEGRGGKRTRIKVGSIARLDADLALALAAKTIRIEAPVPGKGFVGIEVPNDEVALVGLRDIMESPEFRRIDSKLRIALGLGVDGTPVAADLTAMPHLLIAGTTGSGKSVCVNSIISCLLLENKPEDVQLIMVDPKRVELTGYNGIPHLVAPVVVDLERIVGVLQWIQREMEERYRKFASIAARNILDYNNKIGPGVEKMPYYVVIVDELADLMMLAPDETERLLARLAQMARATGIHLVISTQRPSVDIITGLIKANFPARIAFAVASSVDSRVILDQPGAEKLLGRGDMLFQSPDAAAPLRMQGVFVSDEEILAITRYWKGILLDQADTAGSEALVSPSPEISINRDSPFEAVEEEEPEAPRPRSKPAQPSFWDQETSAAAASSSSNGNEDDLYEEAVELIQRLQKASISLLQRRLRIGYTRAARLIDMMEADGIVGPAESGSKPREVLLPKPEAAKGED